MEEDSVCGLQNPEISIKHNIDEYLDAVYSLKPPEKHMFEIALKIHDNNLKLSTWSQLQ
jgi:hypothetical protein